MESNINANKLIREKSPYLLQHAYNPVNWYPWGDEAFEKAKAEDKPIFLSIGYSTCHWCHVMERESFEDQEVADLLNKYFISIKVDREERPDIDNIYMRAAQIMTGRGGWPLSIFMTPDKLPFHAATYIPKTSQYRMYGIIELIDIIHKKWHSNRDEIMNFSNKLREDIKSFGGKEDYLDIEDESLIEECYRSFKASFDSKYGGFGSEPKFPSAHNLLFLLRYAYIKENKDAYNMVTQTLDSMIKGGLYDHIGGGFSRYSTDNQWLVPHFEKMLYDNALIIMALSEAYMIDNKEVYKTIINETIEYLSREMTASHYGFFSAQDADSEGIEGKYYVWDKSEIMRILGEEKGNEFCKEYAVSDKGNFEGKNIINLIDNKEWGSAIYKLKEEREQLFKEREKRIKPHTDDKILTSWNGLMIAALMIAGRALNNDNHIQLGKKSFQFIENHLIHEDSLYSRYRDSETKYLGYIDDYAFMLWATLESFETTNESYYLKRAIWYADKMIDLFWDKDQGGFYFSGLDSEKLIINTKESFDSAMPSGNSAAIYGLIRLSRFLDDDKYYDYAIDALKAFSSMMNKYPSAHAFMATSIILKIFNFNKFILAGNPRSSKFALIERKLKKGYIPLYTKVVLGQNKEFTAYKEYYDKKNIGKEDISLYICKDYSCMPVINNLDQITSEIEKAIRI